MKEAQRGEENKDLAHRKWMRNALLGKAALLIGAGIEYWEPAMIVGNINHALLTGIVLFWLKKVLSNLAGSCLWDLEMQLIHPWSCLFSGKD